jgi:hypothetical protein
MLIVDRRARAAAALRHARHVDNDARVLLATLGTSTCRCSAIDRKRNSPWRAGIARTGNAGGMGGMVDVHHARLLKPILENIQNGSA